jgi:hypothetical protein
VHRELFHSKAVRIPSSPSQRIGSTFPTFQGQTWSETFCDVQSDASFSDASQKPSAPLKTKRLQRSRGSISPHRAFGTARIRPLAVDGSWLRPRSHSASCCALAAPRPPFGKCDTALDPSDRNVPFPPRPSSIKASGCAQVDPAAVLSVLWLPTEASRDDSLLSKSWHRIGEMNGDLRIVPTCQNK